MEDFERNKANYHKKQNKQTAVIFSIMIIAVVLMVIANGCLS